MDETFCLDINTVDEICQNVNRIMSDLNDHREEVYSLKEDIKLSIIFTMEQLITEGYTHEDALEYAVNQHENDEFINREIQNLKQNNKDPQKIYYNIARISIIITSLLLITAFFHNVIVVNFTFHSKSSPVIEKNLVTDEIMISEDTKKSLRNFVNEKWFVEGGALYTSNVSHTSEIPEDFDYAYNQEGKLMDKEYFLEDNAGFLLKYSTFHERTSIANTNLHAVYSFKVFGEGFFVIIFMIVIVYWIAFTLWARVNVVYAGYDRKWVLLIALTNIIGYLIFEYNLNEQRKGYPLDA